jgi:lysophospholipase L1-like esterase
VPAAIGPTVDFVGGWAVPGAPTAAMRAGARPVAADVLVLMAGTNDVRLGVDWPETEDNLVAIVETVGIGRVLVSAIPPYDPDPGRSVDFNRRLEKLAADRGWTFLTPWSTFDDDGSWTAGASADGVHPVPSVAAEVGRQLNVVMAEGR